MAESDHENELLCCTWKPEENCEDCDLNKCLDCRWDSKHLLRFFYYFAPMLMTTTISLVIGGIFIGSWWTIAVVIGYMAVFFIVETRILCSHCPYYSEDTKILHCLANHGFYKFYKYHPERLSPTESNLLKIGFLLFGLTPLITEFYNLIVLGLNLDAYGVLLMIVLALLFALTIVSVVFFFKSLTSKVCVSCVNFSCPLNKVPEEIVQKYLDRNEGMKKAWEEESF